MAGRPSPLLQSAHTHHGGSSIKDLNSVALVGRLTKEPEAADDQSWTRLRIACTESFKDSSDNWQERPNYFSIVVFGGQAKSAAEHLTKGQQVAVTGRLSWREYEQDGQKRESISVVAQIVQFLAKPRPVGDEQATDAAPADTSDLPFGT